MTILILRGLKAIGLAAGIHPRKVKHYVDKHQLPAYMEDDGEWRARPTSINEWLQRREAQRVKPCQ